MQSQENAAAEEGLPPLRVGPRFTLGGELGQGAFGAVYVARDHILDRDVALKRLLRVDPAGLFRFKQEFRALTGLFHPNLVRMHELFSVDDDWFFTMDLIEGVHFKAFVRGGEHDSQSISTVVVPGKQRPTMRGQADEEQPVREEPAPASGGFSEERLRHGIGQLALGVQALHDAGMLHRDLKPSNVLVASDGDRVKILDFGLVSSLRGEESLDGRATISGTPAYMAPEQALVMPLTSAADWYAVGVMLYEALRGRLPFIGGIAELVQRRRGWQPSDPREFSDGMPDDLCELALSLLRYEPVRRPSGPEVLAALGLSAPGRVKARRGGRARPRALFVGRQEPLAALRAALEESRRGQPVLVEIMGPSGIGKSTLAQEFLDAAAAEDAVVLRGRCYQHESLPFKALDGVIDALAQHVAALTPAEQASVCPKQATALSRLFPVLGQVAFVSAGEDSAPNPQEQRRRAFSALRELLVRMAALRPVILFIDDVQWSDEDSAALLGELCAPSESPALLLIGCSRPVGSEHGPRLFEEVVRRAGAGAQLRRVELGPLSDQEARTMAQALLDRQTSDADVTLAAEAARGSPLFVAELARALRDGRAAHGNASLADVLAARIERLPSDARLLLELLAVVGRPVDEPLLRLAASRERAVGVDAVAELGAAQLVRTSGSQSQPTLETPHDRIREEIVARIAPDALARYHAHLAAAIAESGRDDPEAMAGHLAAAGDRAGAAVHAEQAADRAAEGLAFDRAVALYRSALEVADDRHGRLRAKLADALAQAGHGLEAARCFLESVEGAPVELALARRRCAAEQLLRSGHIDEGIREVAEVLDAVGMRFPYGRGSAVGSLLFNRLRLTLRGRGFRERAPDELDQQKLRDIDICWSVGNGLGGVDLLRGAGFQAKHLVLALGAGEPYRIARALAWEAVLRALEDGQGQRMAAELAATAEEIAQRISHPHATAWAAAATAVTAWCEGRWRDCSQLCEYSAALFRERCNDIFWELGSLEIWFNLPSLYFLGDLRGLARRAPASARESEERGDLYAATTVRTYIMPLVYLSQDDPLAARKVTSDAIGRWSSEGWHLQHWSDVLTQTQVDLYVGDVRGAARRLEAAWPKVTSSHQLLIQNIRVQASYWRARAAIAVALLPDARAEERTAAARLGTRTIDRLRGEAHPMATGLAASLELAVGLVVGACAPWELALAAAQAFRAAEMPLFTDAHELVAGCLSLSSRRPDPERATFAIERLANAGVASPIRFAQLLCPTSPGLLDRAAVRTNHLGSHATSP